MTDMMRAFIALVLYAAVCAIGAHWLAYPRPKKTTTDMKERA